MGLDQYLYAEKYVSGWPHTRESMDETHKQGAAVYDQLIALTGIRPSNDSPSFRVTATVGYWRKANAVHKWFVEHCQEGNDDCGTHYVSREQLAELREACKAVLNSEKPAEAGAEWLPTQAGFFFGSTEYDEHYLSDLADTVETIDRVLTDSSLLACDFQYSSSW